jgi:hypothetical protein
MDNTKSSQSSSCKRYSDSIWVTERRKLTIKRSYDHRQGLRESGKIILFLALNLMTSYPYPSWNIELAYLSSPTSINVLFSSQRKEKPQNMSIHNSCNHLRDIEEFWKDAAYSFLLRTGPYDLNSWATPHQGPLIQHEFHWLPNLMW